MNIDEFIGLVRSTRTIRHFLPNKDIPEEYVEKVIEAARLASSGANSQPWEFIVVRNPETRKKITDLFIEAFRKWVEIDPDFFHPERLSTVEVDYQNRMWNAPVHIVVCADPRLKAAYPQHGVTDTHQIWLTSIGLAIQNIHLAAKALGLSTGWNTVEDTGLEHKLRELLDIPINIEVLEVITLGYASALPKSPYRRPLSSVMHKEKLQKGQLRTLKEIKELLVTRKRSDIYSGKY